MKVYAKVMVGTKVEKWEVTQDLGLEIVHDGKIYSLAMDNYGKLTFRSINDVQLILLPQSSNSVEVDSK